MLSQTPVATEAAPDRPPPSALRPARGAAWWTVGRQAWVVALLALAVLVPRSLSITRAHGMTIDDGYHLRRGFLYWHRAIPDDLFMNDPLLGEAISALPILGAKELPPWRELTDETFGEVLRQRSLNRIAVLKSILFVPAVVLAFAWAAGLYGAAAGWLAAALLLVDPTFAGHVPLPTIDVLGVEAAMIAWLAVWRCVERPTPGRGAIAGATVAAALLVKHTAVILPPLALATAAVAWGVMPWMAGDPDRPWPRVMGRGLRAVAVAVLVGGFTLWALMLFDVRAPRLPTLWTDRPPAWALFLSHHRLPAGAYVKAFMDGTAHARYGHPAFLLGQVRSHGWWYYFPVVFTLKVPLGFYVVMLLAVASLAVVRPRAAELSLLVPLVAWTALLMQSRVDIGFRHFLPAYVFLLMLSARCLAARAAWWRVIAWCGVTWAAVHVASYHPDELSYVNRDVDKVWLRINDSNLDWGQAPKQVRTWVEATVPPGRLVTVVDFWHGRGYWLGPRVNAQVVAEPLPTGGLLITSPMLVTGQYTPGNRLSVLQAYEPVAVIGHSLLVYDLDLLANGKPFDWNAPPAPPAK